MPHAPARSLRLLLLTLPISILSFSLHAMFRASSEQFGFQPAVALVSAVMTIAILGPALAAAGYLLALARAFRVRVREITSTLTKARRNPYANICRAVVAPRLDGASSP